MHQQLETICCPIAAYLYKSHSRWVQAGKRGSCYWSRQIIGVRSQDAIHSKGSFKKILQDTRSPAIKQAFSSLKDLLISGSKDPKNAPNSESLASIKSCIISSLATDEDEIRPVAASCLGAYIKFIDEGEVNALLSELLVPPDQDWKAAQGGLLSISHILSQRTLQSLGPIGLVPYVKAALKFDKVPVREAAVEVIGTLLCNSAVEEATEKEFAQGMIDQLNDASNSVKVGALKVIKLFAKKKPENSQKHFGVFIPALMTCVKERKVHSVKLASERALLHLLQIKTNPEILKHYLQTLDTTQNKRLVEYVNRVLSKLSADSEDEELIYSQDSLDTI